MATPKTWKGVVKRFKALPGAIQHYFEHFPKLAADFPWEVSLAYAFSRLELAHNMAIYCGAVKLHRADGTLARVAVQNYHMTRDGFADLFQTIHAKPIPPTIQKLLRDASDIRDRTLHGKQTTPEEHRRALTDLFEYSEQFNTFVQATSGFKPFNDLRGFKGRATPLDKSTTRWLLKGMGFPM